MGKGVVVLLGRKVPTLKAVVERGVDAMVVVVLLVVVVVTVVVVGATDPFCVK